MSIDKTETHTTPEDILFRLGACYSVFKEHTDKKACRQNQAGTEYILGLWFCQVKILKTIFILGPLLYGRIPGALSKNSRNLALFLFGTIK
jgi:hypothetical protein